MNSDNTPASSTDLYFEDAQTLHDEYSEQRAAIRRKQAALEALCERLAHIDCDHGSASLEIDNDGTITVGISTPKFPDEVKSILHDFQWPRKFATGYDTMSECLTWSLKTDIETLIEDHERNQQTHAGATEQAA
ncbi:MULTISPECIES: hypothetical protein [Haloferacaceae]|uniref:Uncharacterized protein n=2 Tax=Haloferacaceae TaxID=1644056 RepID=A0ABD6DB51_9EURY|nr:MULTISPECIES: hypothetical protein [Halorubraceae]